MNVHVNVHVHVYVCVCVCVCMCMCMYVYVCFVAAGVLLLVFRGQILGFVRRRTTTEPFTKDVVIDHERRLGD